MFLFDQPGTCFINEVPYGLTRGTVLCAKTQLAYSDAPLAQIAVDCGFSYRPYFTVRFQKETGMTPL